MVPPAPPPKSKGAIVTQTKLYPLFAKHAGTCKSTATAGHEKRNESEVKLDVSDSDDDDEDDDDEDNFPLSMLAKQPSQKPKPTATHKPGKRPRPTEDTQPRESKVKRSKSKSKFDSRKAFQITTTRCDAIVPSQACQSVTPTKSATSSATTSTSVVSTNPETHMNCAMEEEESKLLTEDAVDANPDETEGHTSARISLSPETNRRQNRIYSDSVMDFVPPAPPPSSNRNKNIVTTLLQRKVHGKLLHNGARANRRMILHQQHINPRQNTYESIKCPNWRWPAKWKTSSWVSLALGTVKTIDHIAWDEGGILLAVATDRVISIYDFDMVRAADMQGRRDRARECHDSLWNISPIVQFYTPTPVSKLLWNQFHPDELVVGFRTGGKVQIYDIDKVAQWLSKDPAMQHILPPKKTSRMIDISRNDGSISDILFLDAENVVVSTSNAMVYRYKFIKRSSPVAVLIWRYQASSTVTAMAQIGTNVCVLGMIYGQICLLDWTKHSKERSFSNDQRPKVLQRLIPHDGLAAPREDILLGKRMGIMKLRVDATTTQCEALKNCWGRCRITWVTKCGWLLSISLESPTTQDKCRVHHASPRVVYRSAEGELIDSARKSWSLPPSSVGAHLSQEFICLTEVPAVTNVLTHHDKFVLDGQPNMIRSKKRALVVFTSEGKQSIPLPKSIKHIPEDLEVHPSHEWILLAEGSRLHLLSCRA